MKSESERGEFDLEENQIEEQLEWISTIASDRMDTKTLILSSKLARTISHRTGKKIILSGGKLLVNLGRAVLEENDQELNKEYFEIVKRMSSKFDAKESSDDESSASDSVNRRTQNVQLA